MRWSQLKKLIEDNFDQSIDLKIYCTVQRGERGSIGRYWFELDGRNIWDEPKNVSAALRENKTNQDASVMSQIMRDYINAPKELLFDYCIKDDIWGLIEVLKAADRRIGARRLINLKTKLLNQAALLIIERRLQREA